MHFFSECLCSTRRRSKDLLKSVTAYCLVFYRQLCNQFCNAEEFRPCGLAWLEFCLLVVTHQTWSKCKYFLIRCPSVFVYIVQIWWQIDKICRTNICVWKTQEKWQNNPKIHASIKMADLLFVIPPGSLRLFFCGSSQYQYGDTMSSHVAKWNLLWGCFFAQKY